LASLAALAASFYNPFSDFTLTSPVGASPGFTSDMFVYCETFLKTQSAGMELIDISILNIQTTDPV